MFSIRPRPYRQPNPSSATVGADAAGTPSWATDAATISVRVRDAPYDRLGIALPTISTGLYDGSEHESDGCRRPHGKRPPEGDTYCARRDTGAAHAGGQRTKKGEEQQ